MNIPEVLDWNDLSDQLIKAGLTQYTTDNYDGYTLYMTMKFTKLVQNGDSIGVEMPLPGDPKKRKIGWGLYYEAFSHAWSQHARS